MSAQGFVDPYQDPTKVVDYHQYDSRNGSNFVEWVNGPHPASSFGDKVSDWLGFSHYDADYNRYLDALDREYERQATNSARAWDLWFDSTKIQRLMEDIKSAGLNPWLALQSGLSAGGTSTTASSGSSARSHKETKQKTSAVQSIAMAVIATAKLFALFA